MNQRALPLAGVKVVELGQLLAGPFAGTLLAYFGAEVIKVEPPGGDPIRGWRTLDDTGTSFWWRSLGRNKRSVTLDLKSDAGRELAARLIDDSDVLIENFRPGTLENWGLGPERFKESNPGLIYTRISGYGQDGPYADKPGYASVCEGIGGLRYVNGFPGERPVRPNLSLGDTVAGLHAALGIALALLERHSSQQGQVVDVALFESVFNLLEAVIPEFDGAGEIRQPAGSTVTGIVPTNTYRCADGKYVIIGGNGDSIFKRLMTTAERPDLAEDPRLAKNPGRVENEAEIDGAIEAWCATLPSPEVLEKLEANRVPCGPIYSAADMMADPHFQARGLFQQVEINGAPLKIPAIMPRLGGTPGGTRWPGGDAGGDTESVARGELGLSEEEFQRLKAQGVFGA
ncbi:MAG: CaiB/BaiF CoA-transferase family protein [Alloalcanivorax venustensis]|jgi:crotonobetainyl-CoA:carnitine CoA-transferase CaiB-like acyl-CoA transferase|uniref:CaiB/BaiF CoA transferase family protein n=1 Tax=Alloalcanivorax venustensis TaxID=172371 RepID=UPI000C981DE1|nr:carnitine dehydratase [Alcanivorax sp.]HAI36282.1 carnitine dehydratase [Alcanivorax sp.]HAI88524.1 carnitine dehydratase [Alcanivorax sp.]HBU65723.1 carnitine dehydratase [Alcanivorax sp.]HCD76624.1 carnitine dehydratase [Alcanivorax sp.]|tara:strand:- start:2780 stop:3982 length:1203 start_codon:yes stop_codon:yes gene_type:complete